MDETSSPIPDWSTQLVFGLSSGSCVGWVVVYVDGVFIWRGYIKVIICGINIGVIWWILKQSYDSVLWVLDDSCMWE